ncbi:Imm7 family immunity protein [Amycolatopsis sp.]|jgi:hypothetical protein|uniref:Imm7 family immunity protein n=1 Tax=Amycolatopsis sp. TaxID=37632 RepID=UPI002DFC613B|nr:Imm7 family immunity protein [Amycolatopsis sp.]
MYEFHGWFGLSEDTYESETDVLAALIDRLRSLVSGFTLPPTTVFEVGVVNGMYHLSVHGTAEREQRSFEAAALRETLSFLCRHLPGSWGLLHERCDEWTDPPGPSTYRVKIVARGGVSVRHDPFLSPLQPAPNGAGHV